MVYIMLTSLGAQIDALAMFNEMDSLENDGTITFEEWLSTRQKYRGVIRHGVAPSLDLSFESLRCVYAQKNGPPKEASLHAVAIISLCVVACSLCSRLAPYWYLDHMSSLLVALRGSGIYLPTNKRCAGLARHQRLHPCGLIRRPHGSERGWQEYVYRDS